MLGIRSHHPVGWEEEIRVYGKEYLPSERTGEDHYVCVGEHEACVLKLLDFTNMQAGIAFRWFLHSRHSFLWISSQREAHCSRALTSRGGSTLPSTFCLPLSHNPTHIWKWEEGNPRWWLKAFCCQGEFSPHLFFVCVYVCVSIINVYQCVHYLLELEICREFKMWL